ncbi:lipoprotein, partial [Mesoplasma seiffertii]|uniref:lipoprotein n=1 Tax=Mesoplasma seiffertii TaxID=28224 RepID=UPI001B7F9E5B
MKKLLTILGAMTLTASASVSAISCTTGKDGINGKSAYDLAIDKGFKGSIYDWLKSLKGADGKSAYDLAVEGGYQGTLGQWIDSLKG